MTASPFVAKPVLDGGLVRLRPFSADDAETMVRIISDSEVGRLTGSVHSAQQALDATFPLERALAWYGSRSEQHDRLDLALVDRSTGEVVGEVVLNEWEPDNAACNFRTLVGPSGRGRGLGTEAARLLLGYAFDVVGLHRVGLEVYDFNPRARHVYEKVGFVHEGTRRDALRFDGGWVDAHVMSILAAEWARHRGRPSGG
jgi:RimJ/RimL family protein N-acetyltransferase